MKIKEDADVLKNLREMNGMNNTIDPSITTVTKTKF